VNAALQAVAAALTLLQQRNAELNTPQMVVAALAGLQQADWDRITADVAAGNLAAEEKDVS
jgi:hypothetical protein